MLKKLFYPKSVALIGASASPGKLGFDILENIVGSEYDGNVYPINPKAKEILGKKSYPNIQNISEAVDLAIIAVPAEFVLDVVKDCVKKGTNDIVIISAGFKEAGEEGVSRELELKKLIEKNNLNIVGPNCLGIINTHIDLNASFSEGMPTKGSIALISQSGAMAVAITDWAYGENIGFSKIVSLGNKAGVSENDCLEYFGKDKETDVIMMYLESFVDGRRFMDIASKIAKEKTIIVFKSGVSEAGSSAIASHTGALAGSDQAVETALRQSGVIRCRTIEDFFDFARAFRMQSIPKGGKVAIVTNAGGPGVIAADAISDAVFLDMAVFDKDTENNLKKVLPKTANIHNPVDIIGDALADRYQNALDIVLKDPNTDIVLTILTPQVMTQKETTVRILSYLHDKYPEKTMFSSFMGGKSIKYFAKKLAEKDIPNFIDPYRAVRSMKVMAFLRTWRENKRNENKQKKGTIIDTELKKEIIKCKRSVKTQLSQKISGKLLSKYKISMPYIKISKSAEEAVKDANEIGYSVALKIESPDILHKTDAGGVRLALKNDKEVKEAFNEIINSVKNKYPQAKIKGVLVQKMYHMGREVIIGMKRDQVFGPLIMFGLGGIYVEVMKDVSFRVAPISFRDAMEMINEVKAIKLLRGVRGQAPSDIKTLAETIIKISELSLDYPEILELDINPLMVFGKGAVALDSRFIV